MFRTVSRNFIGASSSSAAAVKRLYATAAVNLETVSAVALRKKMEEEKRQKQLLETRLAKLKAKAEEREQRAERKRQERQVALIKKIEKFQEEEKLRLFKEKQEQAKAKKHDKLKLRLQQETEKEQQKVAKLNKIQQQKERELKKQAGKPKRAMTAFMWFYQQNFKSLAKEVVEQEAASSGVPVAEVKISVPKVLTAAKAQFESFSPEQRQVYERLATEDKARYQAEMTRHRRQKEANKKPVNAYMLFANERQVKIRTEQPELKITEVAKQIGQEWRALAEAEKTPYKERAQKALEEYNARQQS